MSYDNFKVTMKDGSIFFTGCEDESKAREMILEEYDYKVEDIDKCEKITPEDIEKEVKEQIDKEQELENISYTKLRKIGYNVEMSEAYIPIHKRRYAVLTNRECIFEGNIYEFIEFANNQEEKIDGE